MFISAFYKKIIKTKHFQSRRQHPAGVDLLRGVPAGGQAGRGAECARHLLDGRQRGGGGARMGHHPPPGAAHSTSRRFIYSSSSQCYAAVLGLMAAVHAGLRRAQPLGDRHLRLHARVSKVPGVPGLVPTVHSHEVSTLHCGRGGTRRRWSCCGRSTAATRGTAARTTRWPASGGRTAAPARSRARASGKLCRK